MTLVALRGTCIFMERMTLGILSNFYNFLQQVISFSKDSQLLNSQDLNSALPMLSQQNGNVLSSVIRLTTINVMLGPECCFKVIYLAAAGKTCTILKAVIQTMRAGFATDHLYEHR